MGFQTSMTTFTPQKWLIYYTDLILFFFGKGESDKIQRFHNHNKTTVSKNIEHSFCSAIHIYKTINLNVHRESKSVPSLVLVGL